MNAVSLGLGRNVYCFAFRNVEATIIFLLKDVLLEQTHIPRKFNLF